MKKSIFYDHIRAVASQEGINISKAIAYAASLGYVGCDVHWRGETDFREIRSLLSAEGLQVSAVYRFWELFSEVDENEAHEFFSLLRESGCDRVMVIPWEETKSEHTDSVFTAVCRRLNRICDIAEEYGVRITAEDFDSADVIINNTAALSRAFSLCSKLFHTFDTGNYAYFGESAATALERFSDRIISVHLKDRAHSKNAFTDTPIPFADGTEAYSCPCGDGYIDVGEFIRVLHRKGYDGYLTVEHFGVSPMKTAMQISAQFVDSTLAELS